MLLQDVDGRLMFFLAFSGIIVNVVNFFVLSGTHAHSHNGGETAIEVGKAFLSVNISKKCTLLTLLIILLASTLHMPNQCKPIGGDGNNCLKVLPNKREGMKGTITAGWKG